MQSIIYLLAGGRGKWYAKLLLAFLFFSIMSGNSITYAQSVLFNFDNAQLHTPLPISLTESGITAHFSATGAGYSIQDNSAPVVPNGFSGRFLYPSSINLSDLLISFNEKITDFSIWYSCQELASYDAATMRVTAYLKGSQVGTGAKTTGHPGTWPVDTLACSFSKGFDSVVVHYDSRPPTCRDYGVVYLADNMRVTAFNSSSILNAKSVIERLNVPNPISQSATISFSLSEAQNMHIAIYDITGKLEKVLFDGTLNAGEHQINWDASTIKCGVYFLSLSNETLSQTCKLIVVK